MKMQHVFWLQESLIQSLQTQPKNSYQFIFFHPDPPAISELGQVVFYLGGVVEI